jgi:1,4-dihydroxy-2-naphthoate octaprenyltransferase
VPNKILSLLRYRFFLHAGALPYILGASITYHTAKTFNLYLFLLGLLGLISAFAGVESFNEYFDPSKDVFSKSKEPANPSRSIFWMGTAAFIAAFLFGIQLAFLTGVFVVFLAGLGFIFAAFYVGPPVRLAYRGLGEVGIFLSYGPLITLGSYYIQSARLDVAPIVASLVPAFLISALAIGNEVADYYEDLLVGKKNIVVRIGRGKGAIVYTSTLFLSYVCIVIGLILGLPNLSVLALLTMPLAFRAAQLSIKNCDNPQLLTKALRHTIILYLTITTILILSFILS